MGRSTTIITKPAIYLKVNGKNYPCLSATIQASLGYPSSCTVVLTDPSDKDGGFLALQSIIREAASIQSISMNAPKKDSGQVTINTGGFGSMEFSGIVSSVTVNGLASEGGGMQMTVRILHKDILLDTFNTSIYSAVAVDPAKKDALKAPDAETPPVVNGILSESSAGDSIATRISTILKQATKFIDGKASPDPTIAQVLEKNKEVYKMVQEFLAASDKSSKLFEEKWTPTAKLNFSIDAAIAAIVFKQTSRFLSGINGIGREFAMFYSPSLTGKGYGTLRCEKYGNSAPTQTVSAPVNTIYIETGPYDINSAPPSICAYRARVSGVSPFSVDKKAQYTVDVRSDCVTVTYPKNPRKEGGRIEISAPAWMGVLPATVAELKPDPKSGKGNTAAELKQNKQKISQNAQTEIQSVIKAMGEACEANYWSQLLKNSSATVVLPLKDFSNLIIGEPTSVTGSGGGKLFTGILSRVTLNASKYHLTATLQFSNVIIEGASIS